MPCEGLGLRDLLNEETPRACEQFMSQAGYLADHFLNPDPNMDECSMTEASTDTEMVLFVFDGQ